MNMNRLNILKYLSSFVKLFDPMIQFYSLIDFEYDFDPDYLVS